MMKAIKKTVILGLFFTLPLYTLAWGVLGHRIVGEVADSYLTAKAKAEIKKILGYESLAMSANWADFIKSDTAFRYLSSWHYVNLDKGLSEEQLHAYFEKDTATDLYTKMNMIIGELKSKKLAMEKKRMYLRLLIHFVGDAHQPLHAGRREDLGGNRVRVSWFNVPTNLHSVWDESLVNFQQLSYTEYTRAINHTSPTQLKTWQKQPVSAWLVESYNIAQTIYADIKEDNQKLSYEYNFRHVETINSQLLKGGVRLAGVLNEIFR